MFRTFLAALGLGLVASILAFTVGSERVLAASQEASESGTEHPVGPGRVPADDFREEILREGRATSVEPVRGGRLVVHIPTRPLHLNRVIEAGADARRILEEVHARLVERNMETWELEPSLAESIETYDRLTYEAEDGRDAREMLGHVTIPEPGHGWMFNRLPVPGQRPESHYVMAKDAHRLGLSTVFDFRLRQDALWHDGHRFDADDVIFTLDTYLNEAVQSEHARHLFEGIRSYEALDEFTVRVEFEKSYFLVLEIFEDDFAILPSHLFDLLDEDNERFDADATPEERAAFIHENPHNVNWIGLGPYRVTEFTDQYLEAERFDDYFDEANGGYADELRWRFIPSDNAAKQALLAGELDFFGRLRSRELLGEFTAQPAFREQYDKGFYYSPQFNFVAWNLRRPLFQDQRARRALAHTFDWQEFIDTIGSKMGEAVTAAWYRFSPAYDAELAHFPYSLERAEELLAEAGWIDRDGDGVLDREGARFEFEFLFNKNDAAVRLIGQKLKENLERIGIVMNMAERDFASVQALIGDREFDATGGSLFLGPEVDPVGIWHSKGADVLRSKNLTGYSDAESDRLIEAIQTELDNDKRTALFHELQARIYDAQPMLFGCMFPVKFAVSKRTRGVQRFYLDPGYSLRRWFILPDSDR